MTAADGTRGGLDVVGFGESSIDHVYVVDELPHHGSSKLRILSQYSGYGGQVATTMAACAALGLRAGYLGAIGDDENGARILGALKSRRVDTGRVIVRHAPTRYAVILVEQGGGDRVVLWDRSQGLDVEERELTLDLVAETQVVHVDATDEPASIGVARLARETGAIVTCDVDTVTTRTTELLSHVTVPILGERVPLELTGLTDPERALRALRPNHAGLLCVTLGERGAAALDGDRFVQAPARPVQAVDTTSAGDVFRAGVIYGLIQRWPLERTLRFANSAAAVACTRRGAMESVPALSEI